MYSLALFVALTLMVQASPTPSTISLSYGDKTARLTADDLAKLPQVRATVQSHNVEGGYEGPQLRDVLASVGVPHGDALRGPSLRLHGRHRCRRRVSCGLFARRARSGVPRSPGDSGHTTKRPAAGCFRRSVQAGGHRRSTSRPLGPPGHWDRNRGRQTLAARADMTRTGVRISNFWKQPSQIRKSRSDPLVSLPLTVVRFRPKKIPISRNAAIPREAEQQQSRRRAAAGGTRASGRTSTPAITIGTRAALSSSVSFRIRPRLALNGTLNALMRKKNHALVPTISSFGQRQRKAIDRKDRPRRIGQHGRHARQQPHTPREPQAVRTASNQRGRCMRRNCRTVNARMIHPMTGRNASLLIHRISSAPVITPRHAGGSIRHTYHPPRVLMVRGHRADVSDEQHRQHHPRRAPRSEEEGQRRRRARGWCRRDRLWRCRGSPPRRRQAATGQESDPGTGQHTKSRNGEITKSAQSPNRQISGKLPLLCAS